MHDTSIQNARRFFDCYVGTEKAILLADVGSRNFTGTAAEPGSIKDLCSDNIKCIGLDFDEGRGVDVVLEDPYRLPFPDNSFDVVTASSCLEHSEFFWELFLEMLRVTKPEGLIYINAPSNGPYHKYPVDCWRFYPDSGHALSRYGRRKGYDCVLLESYLGNKRAIWADFVCVILKDGRFSGMHPDRITAGFYDFTHGSVLIENDYGFSYENLNDAISGVGFLGKIRGIISRYRN